jgi:hypothetical protein
MPNYMLLLYAPEPADAAEIAARDADLPEWKRAIEEFDANGSFVGSGRLLPVETATTIRVRDHETELTDGPFAVTKEILGGYFLIDVPDLDAAVKVAERLPVARYGSVEVRPERTAEEMAKYMEKAAAGS